MLTLVSYKFLLTILHRWNANKIAQFSTSRDEGTLTSRVQFRRNREITDALLGSVVSHSSMILVTLLFVAPARILGAYGLISQRVELPLTSLAYPMNAVHALLHPVLTVYRHQGLWSQCQNMICCSGSEVEQEAADVGQEVVEHVTAGGARKKQDCHFEMLNSMWNK